MGRSAKDASRGSFIASGLQSLLIEAGDIKECIRLFTFTAETHLPAGRQEGRREGNCIVCPEEFSGQTKSFILLRE